MTRLDDGDDLEIAEPEDFGINRKEGELQPVKQRIPGTDKAIKCIPLVPSVRTEYSDVLDSEQADADRVAELWDECVVEGVGADATEEDVENMPHGLIAGVNQAIKNSSGEQIFLAVREQINEEIISNVQIAKEMDDDTVQALLDSVDFSDAQS